MFFRLWIANCGMRIVPFHPSSFRLHPFFPTPHSSHSRISALRRQESAPTIADCGFRNADFATHNPHSAFRNLFSSFILHPSAFFFLTTHAPHAPFLSPSPDTPRRRSCIPCSCRSPYKENRPHLPQYNRRDTGPHRSYIWCRHHSSRQA